MATEYSIETCRRLEAEFGTLGLHRPLRITHYDAGTELSYDMTPVEPGSPARISLVIEKFVGGGFAGQVYKVRLSGISVDSQPVETFMNLAVGATYAVKILIPPSSGSLLFRNFLYAVGFQGPFQLQVNPTAARAGALWQKFIRAAAQIHFNDPHCVNDIHATFVDATLGSCGEISDWVEGRTWRLEVDDRLDALKRWKKGKPVDKSSLGSPEYRAKYHFMTEFVDLLHQLGAHEFARQYEWTTAKSQPNCLKRLDTTHDPTGGLIGVDFRAGLALLPFLPMSPGDFKLIGQGLKRGSLVQFDRGDLRRLESYLLENPKVTENLPAAHEMLDELKACEAVYRNSIPDITHNHIRWAWDGGFRRQLFDSAVTGWQTRSLIDTDKIDRFRNSRMRTFLFFLLGLIPILGRVGRKIWARADWRTHYRSILSSADYFKRAFRGRMLEKLIQWHRAGRITRHKALRLKDSLFGYLLHVPLSLLPAGMHRFLTDPASLKEKLHFLFVRPFKLYFHAPLREQWLRDMVQQGKNKHILSNEDAETILSQINEPYIQKYLVSLVVHLMTLPVTQIVSVIVAAIFYWTHPEMPEKEKAAAVAGILVLFQIIPISPGSFCRGLYTTIMAIRDRNFTDYNIALFLSYFKYVGYLAFPIQMTYRYPALARFMAAHWATDAVHIVPVFGERGALFEHWVFCAFYNWPLTLRRRMQRISTFRREQPACFMHIPFIWLAGVGLLAAGHYTYFTSTGIAPSESNKWYIGTGLFALIGLLPIISGWCVTRLAGGLPRTKRIGLGAVTGLFIGIGYSAAAWMMEQRWDPATVQVWVPMIWRSFILAIFCTIGVILAEITQPEPD